MYQLRLSSMIAVADFLHYFSKIHQRSIKVINKVPSDKLGWKPKEGMLSFGEIIIHVANINRQMYAESAKFELSKYSGYTADSDIDVMAHFLKSYEETHKIFASLTDDDMLKKTITPAGVKITLWKWLRAMIEHEVHHRGQIYSYLALLGIDSPPLYGLTSEQVKERSNP